MDDLAAILTALGALVIAFGTVLTVVLGYLSTRKATVAADAATVAADAATAAKAVVDEAHAALVVVGGEVHAIGPALDGRLTQLLKTQLSAALAAGRIEGAATERATVAAEKVAEVEGVVALVKANGTAAALQEAGVEGTAKAKSKS